MSASDLAIVAALVFAWGTLSARLERFDVTAPIVFVVAGVMLTHGPLAPRVSRRPRERSRRSPRSPSLCCFGCVPGWAAGPAR